MACDVTNAWQKMAAGQDVKMEFTDALNKLTRLVFTVEYVEKRNKMAKKLAVQEGLGGEFKTDLFDCK